MHASKRKVYHQRWWLQRRWKLRLTNLCAKVRSTYRGKTGRKYEQVGNAVRNFIVRCSELKSVYLAEEKLLKVKEQLKFAEQECSDLHKRCETSYMSLQEEKATRRTVEERTDQVPEDIERLNLENT